MRAAPEGAPVALLARGFDSSCQLSGCAGLPGGEHLCKPRESGLEGVDSTSLGPPPDVSGLSPPRSLPWQSRPTLAEHSVSGALTPAVRPFACPSAASALLPRAVRASFGRTVSARGVGRRRGGSHCNMEMYASSALYTLKVHSVLCYLYLNEKREPLHTLFWIKDLWCSALASNR